MHYSTLLFDLDDTLLDFQAAEYAALTQLFAQTHHKLTPTLRSQYHDLNQQMWQDYELGNLTRRDLLATRFTKFFTTLGETVDGPAYEKLYRQSLAEGHQKITEATELLATLKQAGYHLFVASNGIGQTQRKRLTASGLITYFDDIFVSEELQAQKPTPEFFKRAAAQIPNFKSAQTLMIGDSLTSDIKGGAASGLDTVWYDPHFQANRTGILPTYQIDHLLELVNLLQAA
ncbi:YjjG family noncanonical pyrimidine nucleotidase [Loigolactobacillus binensis]|uniref:YjjG family noncanonical pyrimidine nucleotidase n=1 Tax=Loigolactobacillus binensis TaxID=2559922 RepID=A0ABW3EC63_9LACO|nr:YjjG family noncanonical pyrimidine nucleotidase [Loigolactobacillus binensis]